MKQETDKSAAVATVVAAVDMARVREPVISAVEQTAQRTTTTAVRIQPAQEQVGLGPCTLSCACNQCSHRFEDNTKPTMARTFRSFGAGGGLRPKVFKLQTF